jgi:hypothetical protein
MGGTLAGGGDGHGKHQLNIPADIAWNGSVRSRHTGILLRDESRPPSHSVVKAQGYFVERSTRRVGLTPGRLL